MSDDRTHVESSVRKRKYRLPLSCAECRRLKVKCDREVPCDHCVKRSCADICPDGARPTLRPRVTLSSVLAPNNNGSVQPRSDTPSAPAMPAGRADGTGEIAASERRPVNGFTEHASAQPSVQDHSLEYAQQDFLSFFPHADEAPIDAHTESTTFPREFTAPHLPRAPAPTGSAPSASTDAGEQRERLSDPNHGLLVLNRQGRSKYLGPTAASEWLRDENHHRFSDETPLVSRVSSPEPSGKHHRPLEHVPFPFGPSQTVSTSALLAALPLKDEAYALAESYQRYFGWSYDVAPRELVNSVLEEAYRAREVSLSHGRPRIDFQDLGMLFMIFAMGVLHNLELAPDDPSGDDFVARARDALTKGRFMIDSSISSLRALNIMAHYHLETDRGRNGDWAWPLWGLAMRIVQAMGLHRDGERWKLPPQIVNERRKIFWETHSVEVFQGNCFSRPCSMPPELIDTKFPLESGNEKTFGHVKFELAQLSQKVLFFSLRVDSPPFQDAMALHASLSQFHRDIPFRYRCRTALLALPSLYPDPQAAISDSPELFKRDVHLTFQQHFLSVVVSETVVNLLRPYFLRAMIEEPIDPTRSRYGAAFLSVVERCNVLIQLASAMHSTYRAVSARHWWFWYHAFNSAICMGTLILKSPRCGLAPTALALMDRVINIFTGLHQIRSSFRTTQNLQWLTSVRARASERLHQPGPANVSLSDIEEIEDRDIAFLGWKTRFIERVGASQTAVSISGPSVPSTTPMATSIDTAHAVVSNPARTNAPADTFPMSDPPPPAAPPVDSRATDQLLLDFWEPFVLSQGENNTSQEDLGDWWQQLFEMPDEAHSNPFADAQQHVQL